MEETEDPGVKFNDARLSTKMNVDGVNKFIYTVTEESSQLHIRCCLCEITVTGKNNLNLHEFGKRHLGNIQRIQSKTESALKSTAPAPLIQKCTAGTDRDNLISILELDKNLVGFRKDSLTQQQLDAIKKETPIIGVEYLVEVQEIGSKLEPKITCLLCEKTLNLKSEVKSHLLSPSHRLRYLESFFPTVRRKFAKVPNIKHWQSPAYDFLESVALRIETKFGREKIVTVQGTEYFTQNLPALQALAELSRHFTEDDTLNFKTIPDPFGSFIKEIPAHEVVNINILAEPCQKPGITLSGKYLGLVRTVSIIPPGSKEKEKDEVLQRISSLRAKLMCDEEQYKTITKYRKRIEKEGDVEEGEDDTQYFRKYNPKRQRQIFNGFKENQGNRNQGNRNQNHNLNRSGSRGRSVKSRSRSRDRGPKSRSRSISPYVLAMQSWNKFKQMESAMLKNVKTKKEVFQKRPEDHPSYGEEWKLFWKKKYNELVIMGRDPNTHDYKSDWIPYWEKKLADLFDQEVLDKTDDLMKKFNLPSVNEPKREDYERAKSPPRRRRSPSPRRRHSPLPKRRHSPSMERYRRSSPSPAKRRKRSRSPRGRSRTRSPVRGHRNHSGDGNPRTRNPSPPHPRGHFGDRGRTGPSRLASQRSDLYSGITELEDRRDRGRSISPLGLGADALSRGHDFHRSDTFGEIEVISVLRILTALEDSLGSLGPHVNKILARSLALEQKRDGASKVILEDPDSVSILDMVKEKLHGQMMAGLLSGSREGAVRISLDNLTRLLQGATKKRSVNPNLLLGSGSDSESKGPLGSTKSVNSLIAQSISTVLVCTGRMEVGVPELEKLVDLLMQDLSVSDTVSEVGKVAREYMEAVALEKKLIEKEAERRNAPPEINNRPVPLPSRQSNFYDDSNVRRDDMVGSGPAYVTPIYSGPVTAQNDHADEFDDFTSDELKSLLDNFESLSKQEQEDLIQYMKKLERNKPEMVKELLPLLNRIQNSSMERTGSRIWSPEDQRTVAGGSQTNKKFTSGSVISIDLGSDSDPETRSSKRRGEGGGSMSAKERKEKNDMIKFKVNTAEKEEKTVPVSKNVFGDTVEDSDDDDPTKQKKDASRTETKSSKDGMDEIEVLSNDTNLMTSEYESAPRNSTNVFRGSDRMSENGSYPRNPDTMNPMNPGLNYERGSGSMDYPRSSMEPGYLNIPGGPDSLNSRMPNNPGGETRNYYNDWEDSQFHDRRGNPPFPSGRY